MGRQEFDIIDNEGNTIKLAVRPANYEEIEEADRIYASKIASLIKEKKKILLRHELDKFLRDQKIWTDTDEKKVETMQEDIRKSLNKLRRGGIKESQGRSIAIGIMEKRLEIANLMSKRRYFDDSTVESFADTEKLDYLIYTCTVKADTGDKYWESFESMKAEKSGQVYQKASKEAMKVFYNFDIEYEKSLPENKWLVTHKFVDKELNYIDKKTGEFVDRDGRPLKQVTEEIIKKAEDYVGDIKEEKPFIDDETNEPVILDKG